MLSSQKITTIPARSIIRESVNFEILEFIKKRELGSSVYAWIRARHAGEDKEYFAKIDSPLKNLKEKATMDLYKWLVPSAPTTHLALLGRESTNDLFRHYYKVHFGDENEEEIKSNTENYLTEICLPIKHSSHSSQKDRYLFYLSEKIPDFKEIGESFINEISKKIQKPGCVPNGIELESGKHIELRGLMKFIALAKIIACTGWHDLGYCNVEGKYATVINIDLECLPQYCPDNTESPDISFKINDYSTVTLTIPFPHLSIDQQCEFLNTLINLFQLNKKDLSHIVKFDSFEHYFWVDQNKKFEFSRMMNAYLNNLMDSIKRNVSTYSSEYLNLLSPEKYKNSAYYWETVAILFINLYFKQASFPITFKENISSQFASFLTPRYKQKFLQGLNIYLKKTIDSEDKNKLLIKIKQHPEWKKLFPLKYTFGLISFFRDFSLLDQAHQSLQEAKEESEEEKEIEKFPRKKK